MDALTLFGLFAVTAMLVCYALEDRSHWFVLLFAASCALGSAYGFLQGAWPFGLVGDEGGITGEERIDQHHVAGKVEAEGGMAEPGDLHDARSVP